MCSDALRTLIIRVVVVASCCIVCPLYAQEAVVQPTAVQTLQGVVAPRIPANRSLCLPSYNATSAGSTSPLAQRRVLVAFAPGAEVFHVTSVLQYYNHRNASVDFYCGSAPVAATPVVLLDTYYPAYVVNPAGCLNPATVNGSQYDVLVVPGGYTSVLSLRIDKTFHTAVLGSFLRASHQRALLTINEAAEVLIESHVLDAVDVAVPWTTPAVAAAFPSVATLDNISVAVVPAIPTEGKLFVGITNAGDDNGLMALLIASSRAVLNFEADVYPGLTIENVTQSGISALIVSVGEQSMPPLNCSSPGLPLIINANRFTLVPMTGSLVEQFGGFVNEHVFALQNASLSSWNATNFVVDLRSSCLGSGDINTCAGKRVAVVVAHGTHDLQLLGLLSALEYVEATPEIWCSDSDEQQPLVYAMPYPSLYPSFAVRCTRFFNESFVVYDNLIFVLGGPVATHRRLREEEHLVVALGGSTTSFALFGTAQALLGPIRSRASRSFNVGAATPHLTTTPTCVFTNVDVSNAGFNVTVNATELDEAVVFEEDEATRQVQRILGGYAQVDVLPMTFTLFAQTVMSHRAWAIQQETSIDRIVGAVFISIAVLLVALVMARKVVQQRLKRSRKSMYVAVHRADEDVEVLH